MDFREDRPVLIKLHGDLDIPDSIVITEEDYITFIQRMGDERLHSVHAHVRGRMIEWPILFLGYSLKDYNLRLLLRTLHHPQSVEGRTGSGGRSGKAAGAGALWRP